MSSENPEPSQKRPPAAASLETSAGAALSDPASLVELRRRIGELEELNRQLLEANRTLERLSMADPLTGVGNRRLFEQTLDIEWRRARRERRALSILLIDIDFFKLFNDTYGHQVGDTSLREVARTLERHLQRAGDMIARYGGEEFAVILPGLESLAAAVLGERLRGRIEGLAIRHELSLASPFLTISTGVATSHPESGDSAHRLVARADHALYLAKSAGRNCVQVAPNELELPAAQPLPAPHHPA